MGEIAELMLNGDMDEETGEWLGNGQGFPRSPSRDRRERQERRNELPASIERLVRSGFDYVRFSPHHFRIESIADFWPAREKWLFLKSGQKGQGLQSLIVELIKRPELAALYSETRQQPKVRQAKTAPGGLMADIVPF